MKLENQVVSLELAKRLKELGVSQESFFVWSENTEPATLWSVDRHDEKFKFRGGKVEKERVYAAFTVAELGEMLPQTVEKEEELYYLYPCAGGNSVRAISYITYRNSIGFLLTGHPVIHEKTEADARAKMLIYLLENNLVPQGVKEGEATL